MLSFRWVVSPSHVSENVGPTPARTVPLSVLPTCATSTASRSFSSAATAS
ncbi:MAG: hypothetical protein IPG17_03195 [Sandaracinaceae bacterium]|nr:hypothetical protein [Sandaracinaceae bacterium]